jgi:hypothetical protein
MPRDTQHLPAQRGGYDGQASNVVTQVTSRPVDTAVRTYADRAGTKYLQLANALQTFGQGFGQLGDTLFQAAAEDSARKATLDAQIKGKAMYDQGLTAEQALSALSPESNDSYKQLYLAEYFRYKAGQDRLEFELHAKAPNNGFDANNPDPKYAQKFASDFFAKKVEGVNDPLAKAIYAKYTAPSVVDFAGKAVAQSIQELQAQKSSMIRSRVGEALSQENRPVDWVDGLKPDFKMLGMPYGEIEEEAYQYALAYGIEHMDPTVLNSFRITRDPALPSFYDRKPENALRWEQDHARLVKMTAKDIQGVNQEALFNNKRSMDALLATAKDNLDFTDASEITTSMLQGVQQGAYGDPAKAGPWSYARSTLKQLEGIAQKNADLVSRETLFDQGIDPRSQGVSQEDYERLFNHRRDQMAKKLGAADDPAKMLEISRDLALSVNSVAPEHLTAFARGHSESLNADISKMPESVQAALPLAWQYYQRDGGRTFIRELSKTNKAAADFYTNVFTFLRHDRTQSMDSAWRAAMSVGSDPKQWDKFDAKQARTLIEDTLAILPDEVAENARNSPAARSWMEEELVTRGALSTGRVPTKEELRTNFMAFHQVIDGQLVDTTYFNRVLNDTEREEIVKAARVYFKLHAFDSGLAEKLGLSPENLDALAQNGRLNLIPEPSRTGQDGPEYRLVLGDRYVTPQSVNLDQLRAQHLNQDYIRTEAPQIDAFLKRMDTFPESPQAYTPELAKKDKERLELYRSIGVITNTSYKRYLDQVNHASALARGEGVGYTARQKLDLLNNHSTVKGLRTAPSDQDVALANLPQSVDKLRQGPLSKNILSDLDAENYGAALGKAVFGSSTVRFVDGDKRKIGVGFDLERDTKTLQKELSRAGVTLPHYGTVQAFESSLKALREGKWAMLPDRPNKLLQVQLEKHALEVQRQLTPDVALSLPENTQVALSVLSMATLKQFPEALRALQSGDYNRVMDLMQEIPAQRRASALTYIRSMARSPVEFKTLIQRKDK